MTAEESPGSTWWREQNRRRTDPDERAARGEALKARLFGDPAEPEPAGDDEPDNGPNTA